MLLNEEAVEDLTRILKDFGYGMLRIEEKCPEHKFAPGVTLKKCVLTIQAEQWLEVTHGN